MVGEAAVPGVVAFDVGVEQEDGDDVAGDSDDVEAPGADQNLTALHGEVNDLVGAGEGGLGGPGDVGFGLLADVGELLAEVAGDGRARWRPWVRRCRLRSGGCRRRAYRGPRSRWAVPGRERYLHGEVGDGAGGEIGCWGWRRREESCGG